MATLVTSHSKEMLDWLTAIGIDPMKTRRIIIDIRLDAPVMIYAEMFGSKEMIELVPPELHDAKIVVYGEDRNVSDEQAERIARDMESRRLRSIQRKDADRTG